MIKTTLAIEGMACGMCESHINDAIRSGFKVHKVQSSFKKGETTILSDEELKEEDIRAVLEPTGYKLLSVTSESYVKKGFLSRLF